MVSGAMCVTVLPVTLNDAARGRWMVHTEASTYLLDMDERCIIRTHGQRSDWPAADLRRDGDSIPLVYLVDEVQVGWPMLLLLQIRDDGVQTRRTTTPVTSITAPT